MTISSGTVRAPFEAFDRIAETYDATFTNSAIGSAQRRSVWKEIVRNFTAGQRILEINCGTGVDALNLAMRGVHVIACDSAPQMIAVAKLRADHAATPATVEFRVLANEQIGMLRNEGPFDGVLSNFSGLNCVADPSFLAYELAQLVRKRSRLVLCLFGCFCIWETVWYLTQGNLRKAVRRVRQGAGPAVLSVRSETTVWYHTVRHMKKTFHPYFRLVGWKGVGVTVPPSYLEFLAAGFPHLFHIASRIDPWLGGCPGFRAMADHMVLMFERT
jgi:ubiquinone/menaquinone biosynthesis C-methylase UbiE